MALTALQVSQLNNMNAAAQRVQLGSLVSSLSTDAVISKAKTYTAASGQATERLVRSELTLTPASTMTLGSNSLVGVRGAVTLTTGKQLTGGFIYGTQGKLIINGTVAIGSGMAYGVMGQLDLTGSTITSGYVAGVGSDIFGVSTGTKAVDMFYGQHADGGTIHSYLRAYGKSEVVFDFTSNGGASVVIGAGTYSTADGYLLVKVNGTDYRVPVFAGVD